MFIIINLKKYVLQNWVCMSYLILLLYSWIAKFCCKLPSFFFTKPIPSNTYSEVTVRTQFSLNVCLQDSLYLNL
jgi:hypothetical protein